MSVETRNYNHTTGNGWRKIQTGPNKGKWALYKNHENTGQVKTSLGPVGAIKSAYNKRVTERQKLTIGEGSAKNPQYTRHPRTGKLKPNPNYTPPTKSNNEKDDNKKSDDYKPGDLTKNPKKAVYSPSLGRYVTGANIKAQAAEDRKKMLEDQRRTKTQGKGSKDDNKKSLKLKISKKDKQRFPGGKDKYSALEKAGARQSSARGSVGRSLWKQKRDRLKAGS